MKKRIGFVMLLVMLTGVVLVVPVAPVVQAEDNCGKVIPIDAIEDSIIATGASGALVVGAPSLPVATAGAAPAAAVAGSNVLAAGAAFLGAFYGTCKALDWVTGDGSAYDVVSPSPGTEDEIGVSSMVPCASLPSVTSAWDTAMCVLLSNLDEVPAWSLPTYYPDGQPANDKLRSTRTAFTTGTTWGGSQVSFPADPVSTLYPAAPSDSEWALIDVNPAARCLVSSGYHANCSPWVSTTAAVVAFPGCATANVGGACGRHPHNIHVLRGNESAFASFIVHLQPEIREEGWKRRLITDVRCQAGPDGASEWVRAESPVYSDRAVSSRLVVPDCELNEIPAEYLMQRVPIGVECPTLGTVCYGNNNVVSSFQMNSELLATATAPDWLECLSAGVDCGTPELSGGLCVWGGHTVASTYCDASTHAGSTAVDPVTAPVTSPTLQAVPHVQDTPTSTVAAPAAEPPPPGESITVPIDPGEGLGGGTLEPGAGECWPSGWGWFNPATWVLKPIKCALVWAFVPTDAAGWASDQWEALETQVPFSYGVVLVEFLDVLSDPTTAAAAELCFGAIPMPEYDDGTNSYDAEEDEDACLDIAAQKAKAQENDALLTLLSWCGVGYVIYRMMIGTLGSVFNK